MIFVSFRRSFRRPVSNVPTAPTQTQPPTAQIFSGWVSADSVDFEEGGIKMVLGGVQQNAYSITSIDLSTFAGGEDQAPLGITWGDEDVTMVSGMSTTNLAFDAFDNVLVVPNTSIAPPYTLSS